jgi:NDP-sugar pyrophosphorylase family protein
MRAMILAAGFGTRLWPLTADRTKPAIPFLGRPLVGYVAEYLASFGVRDVAVNLHHQPASVREALGDGSRFGVNLRYVHEPEILGTSGALDNAREILEGETFVVINGKIITDIDLSKAIETHRSSGALATLVLRANPLRERFSVVHTRDGLVTGFRGMPEPAKSSDKESDEPPLMFTGIQILEPRVFDYIPRGVFSHSTTDVYPQAIANGEQIAAHIAEGAWYELSTIDRYLEISLKMMARENRSVDIGQNASISTAATVTDSILWDDVTVEDSAKVSRAILGDGIRINPGESIENAAVVRKELVEGSAPPAKAMRGFVDGDNFVVPLTQ